MPRFTKEKLKAIDLSPQIRNHHKTGEYLGYHSLLLSGWYNTEYPVFDNKVLFKCAPRVDGNIKYYLDL